MISVAPRYTLENGSDDVPVEPIRYLTGDLPWQSLSSRTDLAYFIADIGFYVDLLHRHSKCIIT